MSTRLVRWFTYNIGIALLPLAVVIILRSLSNSLSLQSIANTPEILFFALVVSATGLGDIYDIASPIGWDLRFRIFQSVLLLGAIWSAILYGGLVFDSIIGPSSHLNQQRLLFLSITSAFVLCIFSTTVEILIGRIDTSKESVGSD